MQNHIWQVRVRAGGDDEATVAVRKHSFQAGWPLHFNERYKHITALEYVLGAIGADVVNGLRKIARNRRVEIDSVEATVQGEPNNPLTHLDVVGEEGHPGLQKIVVKVYVSSLSPAEKVQRVWEEMLRTSPLVCTFRPVLDFDVNYKLIL